jgi:hypothetical protein
VVQIVYSSRRGSRSVEHLGSAHDDGKLEALKAVTRQRLAASSRPGRTSSILACPPGLPGAGRWTSPRRGWAPVGRPVRAYGVLGIGQATGDDEVFRQLLAARIIEPTSEQGPLRVQDEAALLAAWYPALNRRLSACARESRTMNTHRGRELTAPFPPYSGRTRMWLQSGMNSRPAI